MCSAVAMSNSANTASAMHSGHHLIRSLYTIAITANAARSSTTNTVSKNTRTRSGTLRPISASRPSARAVSVDIATPQPCALDRPAFTAR